MFLFKFVEKTYLYVSNKYVGEKRGTFDRIATLLFYGCHLLRITVLEKEATTNKRGAKNSSTDFSTRSHLSFTSYFSITLLLLTDPANAINTPSTTFIQDPNIVPMYGQPACQPIMARQLQWNWTPAGQVAYQPCPIGAQGLAKWFCSEDSENSYGASWDGAAPDMSECKSLAMVQLENQVREQDPENVLVSTLLYTTRTKALFGGDLEVVVDVMRTVAARIQYRLQSSSSFHDKSNHIKCDYCDYSSFQPYMLKRHIEKQHNKSKQYKCNLCEKVFYAPGYLRAHQQRTHNKKKQFVCDKCDKAFDKKTQWAQHLFETHNIVYQYK